MSARWETEIRTLPPAAERVTLDQDYSRSDSLIKAWEDGDDVPLGKVHEIMRNWHNEQHAGAYQTCTEQPCDAIGWL